MVNTVSVPQTVPSVYLLYPLLQVTRFTPYSSASCNSSYWKVIYEATNKFNTNIFTLPGIIYVASLFSWLSADSIMKNHLILVSSSRSVFVNFSENVRNFKQSLSTERSVLIGGKL